MAPRVNVNLMNVDVDHREEEEVVNVLGVEREVEDIRVRNSPPAKRRVKTNEEKLMHVSRNSRI